MSIIEKIKTLKPCCCIPLRVGINIVAVTQMGFSVLGMIFYVFYWQVALRIFVTLNNFNVTSESFFILLGTTVLFFSSCFECGLSIRLLVAVKKRDLGLCKGWLIPAMVCNLIFNVLWCTAYSKEFFGQTYIIVALCKTLFGAYGIIVGFSFVREMKQEQGIVNDSTPIVNPSENEGPAEILVQSIADQQSC